MFGISDSVLVNNKGNIKGQISMEIRFPCRFAILHKLCNIINNRRLDMDENGFKYVTNIIVM